MRRLNVAFSRAKKKMIIIGNLETLCTESNHVDWKSTIGIKPAEVFKKLREIKEHSVEKTSLAILKDAIARGIVYPGYIFEGCVPVYSTPQN
jgi:superfamily I DNA and/or RNA helicase